MSWLWHVMRPIGVPLIRTAFRVSIRGRRNIPKRGAAILASNHLSALDHVVLPMATSRPIVNISKAEHFDKPLKAWFFRKWHVIRLRRGSGDTAALDAAKQALREGKLFCIYPEGTRSTDGKLHKGHTGVARLALECQVPVIPVAMVGTYEAKPKGGKTRYLTKTGVVVGEPLDFSQHWGKQDDKELCRRLTDQVMHAIAALSGQEYVHEYTFNPEVPSHAKAAAQQAHSGQVPAGSAATGPGAGTPAADVEAHPAQAPVGRGKKGRRKGKGAAGQDTAADASGGVPPPPPTKDWVVPSGAAGATTAASAAPGSEGASSPAIAGVPATPPAPGNAQAPSAASDPAKAATPKGDGPAEPASRGPRKVYARK